MNQDTDPLRPLIEKMFKEAVESMTDPIEWDEDSAETWVGTCERCGEVRPLQHVVDPFVREGITEGDRGDTSSWCKPCYELRCDDV